MFYNLQKHKSAFFFFILLIFVISSIALSCSEKSLNNSEADKHNKLGLAYVNSNQYQEAVDAFKQAIRIKPDYAGAHYNLGFAYVILKDKDSALDEYKILKDLDKEMANKLFNIINH